MTMTCQLSLAVDDFGVLENNLRVENDRPMKRTPVSMRPDASVPTVSHC